MAITELSCPNRHKISPSINLILKHARAAFVMVEQIFLAEEFDPKWPQQQPNTPHVVLSFSFASAAAAYGDPNG